MTIPHARYVSRDEMAEMLGTRRYFGGLLDRGACHLHPLNYVLGLADAALAADVRLFEHSRVVRIETTRPPIVTTEHGRVEARYVVLAMNGYLGRLVPELAGWIMPINNFMLATAPLGEAAARALIRDDVAVADSKFVVDYFRLSADRRLLFGGGETYGPRFPSDIKSFVRRYMLRVFPAARRRRDRLRLGRDGRDHAHPPAPLRPPRARRCSWRTAIPDRASRSRPLPAS